MKELKLNEKSETGCCPRFNPDPWQEKEIIWDKKLFILDHIRSLMHIPINFGAVVANNVKLMEKAGAKNPERIILSDEKSLWGSDIYIAIDKEVPDVVMVHLSGRYLTKVFEGGYNNIGAWVKEMNEFVEDKGKVAKKLYFSYTTCPACVKAYGKNYVVIFAQI